MDFIDTFKDILAKYGHVLVNLYNISEIDNLKENNLNASVGLSREKDLASFLSYFMPIKSVKYYISDRYPYDIKIFDVPYSIKHQTGNKNTNIKVKWAVKEPSVYINNFKEFDYNLIIVSLNRDKTKRNNRRIIFYIIEKDKLNYLLKMMVKPFKSVSRGIEFTTDFIKVIKHNSEQIIYKSDLLNKIDNNNKKSLDSRFKLIENMIKVK